MANCAPMDTHQFDPERAAAGEPVQLSYGSGWCDVKYVGKIPGKPGGYVIYKPDGTLLISQCLRMKPMPTKKWVLEFDSVTDAMNALATIAEARLVQDRSNKLLVPDMKKVEIPPTA